MRNYDRAAQWCKRVEEFSRKWRMGLLFAICRTQYASILMWRGDWAAAESELLTAQREIAHYRPDLVKACTVRLAELRRRQGRWEEAANLFAQVESHILSLLGRAALALDQDEAEVAVDFAERYLRRIPASDRTERVSGLELLVRAQVALSKTKEAKTALAELQAVSAMVATEPLRAAAKFAEGIFAAETEDWETARQCFEDAVDLYERLKTPFECGRSRLELAGVFFALEQNQRADTEACAALTVLQQIGAAKEAKRAEALGREIKSARAVEERVEHAAEPEVLTRREKEILQLVAAGQSNEEIAANLFLSVRTVERHLVNIYGKLDFSGKSARAAAAAYSVKQGLHQ